MKEGVKEMEKEDRGRTGGREGEKRRKKGEVKEGRGGREEKKR